MAERRLDPQRVTAEPSSRTVSRRNQPISIVSLDGTLQTIYTASSSLDFMVRLLWVCETAGTDATITVHLVAPGATASTANMIYSQAAVSARQTLRLASFASDVYGLLLPPDYSIQAKCTGALNIGGWGQDYYGD